MDEQLLSDDLMPNDGSAFYQHQDQEAERETQRERALVEEGAELLKHVLVRLTEQIDRLRDIDTVDLESKQSVEVQIGARQLAVQSLGEVRSELEILQRAHLQ